VQAAHAGYYLSVAEQQLARRYSLTDLWTLKEAAWKALRCDDALPFTALELRGDALGRIRAVRLWGAVRPARATVLRPWPGYVLALVWVPETKA